MHGPSTSHLTPPPTTRPALEHGGPHGRHARYPSRSHGQVPWPSTDQTCVLLAEDDPEMRRLLEEALVLEGYQVLCTADGRGLAHHLEHGDSSRDTPPDLVISDIRMPGPSGLEVLNRLREHDWAMPVILITAFGDQETHEEARRLGATAILDKPFEMDTFIQIVRAIQAPRL